MIRSIKKVYDAPQKHWVGDGFEVHSMFNYNQHYQEVNPFLLMDYASPRMFEGNRAFNPPGVGEHPHRGFETITVAYKGEVSHKDSYGGGGTIKTGDVQWMTAGSGLMHEEFHSEQFAKDGGMFEMVQLWLNLPAKDKMTKPNYQAIESKDIPVVQLDNGGHVRVIAGEYGNAKGTAKTFTEVNMLDVKLSKGSKQDFEFKQSHNVVFLVRNGKIKIQDKEIGAAQLITFEQTQGTITIETFEDSELLILTGEPIMETVVGYGPFVMNSDAEILQAIKDVQSGKFGSIAH